MSKSFNKIKTSSDVQQKLYTLKASNRTRITPNLIARVAICHSLNIASIPNPEDYDLEGQEFNRYTLTGEYDTLLTALVKHRLIRDGLDPEKDFYEQFRAHLNRGVLEIYPRFKHIEDVSKFFSKALQDKIRRGRISE